MPKRAKPGTESDIVLEPQAQTPLYKQIYERLRAQILTGQLGPGARLPSTRRLASELGISRNTAALAYELLLLEGYIESRVGDGSRVAQLPPEHLANAPGAPKRQPAAAGKRAAAAPAPQQTLPGNRQRLEELYAANQTGIAGGPFRVGEPDVTYFPYAIWARLLARHARNSLPAAALYQHPAGYDPLRQAIAAHIGVTRGIHCASEQIVLTAGAQGALDLIMRVLLAPGEPAWMEDPGYTGARGALLAAGADLVPVPIDEEGLVVETGYALRRAARLVVVTPSHQFPTAVTMSRGRRLALLQWARAVGAWIIEDDYDSEYRYSGRPLEALQGLDRSGRVIYVGTFSKALFPALRIGYLVAPDELLPRLVAARNFVDVHPPLLEQMALAEFMAEGHFARHLRKMRLLYLQRRNALVAALRHELSDTLEVAVPEAGLHLVAWLPAGMAVPPLLHRIAALGLRVLPASHCSVQPLARDGLVLGFAGAEPEALRAGVHLLAQAFRA